ncbi:MAG: shikimate kinase [Lachnospiraceae bacterium]|nr:shikimate kinase [Lachnospiraceae bacterium]
MNNIILIGMPGCGKSTVGVVLAKAMGYDFLDSDLLIQQREGRVLSRILEEEGPDAFNRIEEDVNASIQAKRTVIATGGSVVYGPRAMEHLREIGTVIYLKLPLAEVAERLGDLTERGVSLHEGQTLEDLYRERIPLYEKYAHLTIDASGAGIRHVVTAIRQAVGM